MAKKETKRGTKREPIYTRIMTINHGKSEVVLCENIKPNLRIKKEIISNNNGNSSIQVDGIRNMLDTDGRFETKSGFRRAFPECEYDKKKLPINLKIL